MTPNRSPDPAGLLRQALGDDDHPPAWQAPAVETLGPAFAELAIHEPIGQGGMAAVYRATQTRLGRVVALKVMRPDLAAQPQFAERFVREARALATLANPHVLTIHDFGERSGWCYLVTEYVDGANLRELMRLDRLSPAEVLRIVPQICAGLHFAHQHGVVHRDIKPENVLVDRHGLVKLADFGLAKLAGDAGGTALTRSGVVFGTPHYMAPEQWEGSASVDHRADIYSLGVVLYELLTGRLPVGTYPPASRQPGVPHGIDDVVQRSLEQEPAQRYQSAREVQRDVEQQGRQLQQSDSVRGAASGTRHGAGGLLAAAVLVLVIGSMALAWFGFREWGLVTVKLMLRDSDQRNEAAVAAIRETVDSGKAWTASFPEGWGGRPFMADGTLSEGVRTTVLAAGSASVLALVLLLAAAAWRRTRYAGAGRLQHVVAGSLLAVPVVATIGVGLFWFGSTQRESSRGSLQFAALVLTVIGLLATVAALWRASAHRVAGDPRAIGWRTRVGVVLASIGAVFSIHLALFASRNEPWHSTVRLPIAAQRLAGKTRIEVLDHLGPPRRISAGVGFMQWTYRGLDGVDRDDAIEFTNGVVTRVTESDVRLVPEVDARGAFRGQSIQELTAAMGPAATTIMSSSGPTLQFADGTSALLSAEGVVVSVEQEPTKR